MTFNLSSRNTPSGLTTPQQQQQQARSSGSQFLLNSVTPQPGPQTTLTGSIDNARPRLTALSGAALLVADQSSSVMKCIDIIFIL
jgi:hypothetical protein